VSLDSFDDEFLRIYAERGCRLLDPSSQLFGKVDDQRRSYPTYWAAP
jgi:hypothetical protein